VAPGAGDGDPRAELSARCDAIEASYEFMLAYASRGLSGEPDRDGGSPVRDALRRFDAALVGLAELVDGFVERFAPEPATDYRAFSSMLERDARAARAAVRLVLAQPALSSQLVDNLNASIHVRTLLTDLFLIDEVLKGVGPGA
jgi:hypothetical protein